LLTLFETIKIMMSKKYLIYLITVYVSLEPDDFEFLYDLRCSGQNLKKISK